MEKKIREKQGYQLTAAEVLEERIAPDIVGPNLSVNYYPPGYSNPGGATGIAPSGLFSYPKQ